MACCAHAQVAPYRPQFAMQRRSATMSGTGSLAHCRARTKLPTRGRAAARPAPRRPLTRSAGRCRGRGLRALADDKICWIQTTSKDVITAGLEAGIDTFLFDLARVDSEFADMAKSLGKMQKMLLSGRNVTDDKGQPAGRFFPISSGDDLKDLQDRVESAQLTGTVIMDAADWQIIPAENLVAAAQPVADACTLLAATPDAASARTMLEALQVGTAGVVLRTEDPAEVRELASYLAARGGSSERLALSRGRVVRVAPAGMGDRACVDLTSLLPPGWGMLVGSFSRCLMLVHSECLESSYIASRPFRVNAGPVHSYTAAKGGKTAYLSELASGSEVLVADGEGNQRSAVVGRVKIEQRPMVLVEVETPDGERSSAILQNAETVRLVAPAGSPKGRAVSVAELEEGDEVVVLQQGGARHTGMAIDEWIREQ
ncbi:unnamed protein product [Pedinophyceae sp. YPF-701]|nr:unnamed protein product [Pedinophyceae sp. YPF-701]